MAAWRINRTLTWCLAIAAALFALGSAYLMIVATDERLTADIEAGKTTLLGLHTNLYQAASGLLVLGTPSASPGQPPPPRPVDTVGYPPESGTPGTPGGVPSEELQERLNQRLREQELEHLTEDATSDAKAYRAVQDIAEERRNLARNCGRCAVVFPAKQLAGLGMGEEIDAHECVLRFNAGHDADDVRDYGRKQTHKAFNPEDGLEMIMDADDGCVLRGECERVLLTRCPPRDSPVTRPSAVSFGGTVYGFIREQKHAEVLSVEEDLDVRRTLNGWFGKDGKSGGGRVAVPSSGFYGAFWFRKICDAVTVYGVPPARDEVVKVEYSTANFVMHNIHNFTTEHTIYREFAREGGSWPNVKIKPLESPKPATRVTTKPKSKAQMPGAKGRRVKGTA